MRDALRHCACCAIIPPAMLRHIARKGTPPQREAALATLATDSHASPRTRDDAAFGARHAPRAAGRRPGGAQAAHDLRRAATHDAARQGRAQRRRRQTGDAEVNEAYDGLGATFDFFWDVYRPQLDRRRGHAPRRQRALRPQVRQRVLERRADGVRRRRRDLFNRFTVALDVIAHELDARRDRRRGQPRLPRRIGRVERIGVGRVRLAGQAVRAQGDGGEGRLADRRRACSPPRSRASRCAR